MAFRRTLASWHRWLGLAFALFLLSQGLTGAVMVFRDELNLAIHGDALRVAPTPTPQGLQSMLDTVRSAHPQLLVERVQYPKHSDEAFLFRMQQPDGSDLRYLAIDPYTGAITRDAPVAEWPVEWLYQLHHQLLLGAAGEPLVGIIGMGLLAIALIAPFLWWPGRQNLRRGFEIVLDKGQYRSLRDLHRVGGIIVVVILVVWALTAMAAIWPTQAHSAISLFAPVADRPFAKVEAREGAALLPLDDIVASVRAQHGMASVKRIRFPGGHGRVVLVFLKPTDSSNPRAVDLFYVNGYTGETLASYEASKGPAGNRLFDWSLPIHTGEALGLPGRILFLVAAFSLPVLAITGVWQWFVRRSMRRANAPQ